MKRRTFLKGTGLIASSSVIWGHTDFVHAAQNASEETRLVVADDLNAKLDKPLTAIIIGAGGRGNVYAQYADRYPESLQIVGVSDINEFRRERMADRFSVKEAYRLGDWSEVFNIPISDNNQPENFIMNMNFEDGITTSFSMQAMTSYGDRRTRLTSTIAASIESHVMGFRAERSRLKGTMEKL